MNYKHKNQIKDSIEVLEYKISKRGLSATYVIEQNGEEVEAHILANKEQLFEFLYLKDIYPNGDPKKQTFTIWVDNHVQQCGVIVDKSYEYTIDFDKMIERELEFFTEDVIKEIATQIEIDRQNGILTRVLKK